MQGTEPGKALSTELNWLSGIAAGDTKAKFTSLAHLLTEDFLKRCYRELNRVFPVSLRRGEKPGRAATDWRWGSGSVPVWLGKGRHCLLVIPGEPALRSFEQLRRIFLKSRQVMERVDVVESAGVN